MPADASVLARRLRFQADVTRDDPALGSPLYIRLLQAAAADVEAGGPVRRLLDGHEGDPGASALALRMLGAVHRLVLQGRMPDLATYYPSAGGAGDPDRAWPAFQEVVATHMDELRPEVDRAVQTNEVGRCSALAPGFLTVAAETGRPLRLLELGSSAGLNLRFDRYAYRAAEASWGDRRSPVDLGDPYVEGRPPFGTALRVVDRRGCDQSPVDPASDAGRLLLLSFVWPEQRRRFQLLRAALDLAVRVPVAVDRADAPDWLGEQLPEGPPGVATVVFHSIVWQYFGPERQHRVRALLEDHGAHASTSAPLAWLRLEPGAEEAELRLRLWPGGHDRLLARSGYHGTPVAWL